jgi:hypothetical protein
MSYKLTTEAGRIAAANLDAAKIIAKSERQSTARVLELMRQHPEATTEAAIEALCAADPTILRLLGERMIAAGARDLFIREGFTAEVREDGSFVWKRPASSREPSPPRPTCRRRKRRSGRTSPPSAPT